MQVMKNGPVAVAPPQMQSCSPAVELANRKVWGLQEELKKLKVARELIKLQEKLGAHTLQEAMEWAEHIRIESLRAG